MNAVMMDCHLNRCKTRLFPNIKLNIRLFKKIKLRRKVKQGTLCKKVLGQVIAINTRKRINKQKKLFRKKTKATIKII